MTTRFRFGRGAQPAPHVVPYLVALAGIALFSIMDALMKDLVLALGTYNTLLWRNAAGAAISGVLWFSRPRRSLTRATLNIHALRAVVSTAMAILFFWGLARIPMAQAVALTFIAPLLSLFLAALLLGERIGRTTVVASSIAFVGVVVIVVGQWHGALGPEASDGTFAVLGSAVLYAFNIVLMRRQALAADPVEVAVSQSVLVTLLLACGSPFLAVVPASQVAWLLLPAAVLSVLSLCLLAWAYARSDASRLATSEYTSFLWAAVLGWAIFDEHVTATTLAGAALIVSGCALAARQRPTPAAAEIEALR